MPLAVEMLIGGGQQLEHAVRIQAQGFASLDVTAFEGHVPLANQAHVATGSDGRPLRRHILLFYFR